MAGVKGMKKGVRRYQNKDGSYTELGKKRKDKNKKNSNKYHNHYYFVQQHKKNIKNQNDK